MNLWLLACLVTCFIDTWAPAVQAQGVFEDCCLAYHPHIKKTVLRRAHSYQRQDVSGSCNLPAVIFHFPRRHKKVCGNPEAKWVQNGMKLLDSRKKHHQGTSGNLQGSHTIGKKLSSGAYRVPPGIRSSKRNASLPITAN
ncbi:C-C motif chemokine 25 isoform X2 [Eptesicus fuscus]|nr:C-C motif chemokine 25 isoform X2 [Eptesicus fuscus]XP_054572764.1 C-C motif chemokine 25 isoform X2 [Eptesicus fuscus]XP_054572765.1 C-C motif chemokine 25 isoform X2 [Eptesicus fuscus]